MRDDGGILWQGVIAIAIASSCPLNVGVLDSSGWWTNEALVLAVRPLSAHELHQLALGSEREWRHHQGHDLRPRGFALMQNLWCYVVIPSQRLRSDYDIREIDEDLYLAVLQEARQSQ